MSIKGTRTEKNLMAAFAGESQASNRYDYWAKVAKKEGFEHIAELFRETSSDERQHAKQFFKHMEGGEVEITATYPGGYLSSTAENLWSAVQGEHEEWAELYPEFGRVAREEGFDAIAATFEAIAEAEKAHEDRFKRLHENVKTGRVFKREEEVEWRCGNCGYVHEGTEPPEECPACVHPKAYFRVREANY